MLNPGGWDLMPEHERAVFDKLEAFGNSHRRIFTRDQESDEPTAEVGELHRDRERRVCRHPDKS